MLQATLSRPPSACLPACPAKPVTHDFACTSRPASHASIDFIDDLLPEIKACSATTQRRLAPPESQTHVDNPQFAPALASPEALGDTADVRGGVKRAARPNVFSLGTEPILIRVESFGYKQLEVAQSMEAKGFSYVRSSPHGPSELEMQFEKNPHIWRILVDMMPSTWDAKTAQMAQQGWVLLDHYSEGVFNEVLIYTR